MDAMTEKARFVLGLMDGRVLGLRANWDEVNVVDVYTVHDIAPYLAPLLVPRTGNAHHGTTWHYTRPPIVGIEYEMDVRGCARAKEIRPAPRSKIRVVFQELRLSCMRTKCKLIFVSTSFNC